MDAPLLREQIELLVDVGLGADQLANAVEAGRQVVTERDQTEALRRLVPDPGRRRDRLRQLLLELVHRRLGVEQAPEQDADDHSSGGAQGSYTPPETPPTQRNDIPSAPAAGRRFDSGETRM